MIAESVQEKNQRDKAIIISANINHQNQYDKE